MTVRRLLGSQQTFKELTIFWNRARDFFKHIYTQKQIDRQTPEEQPTKRTQLRSDKKRRISFPQRATTQEMTL